jgi:hypothetical protein
LYTLSVEEASISSVIVPILPPCAVPLHEAAACDGGTYCAMDDIAELTTSMGLVLGHTVAGMDKPREGSYTVLAVTTICCPQAAAVRADCKATVVLTVVEVEVVG